MKMEDEVWEKLRSGIYPIKIKKGQAAKSNVWDRFSEIVAAGDNSSIGYVYVVSRAMFPSTFRLNKSCFHLHYNA